MIELTMEDKHAVNLPGGLAASPLTLSEIGAIACMACLVTPQENEDGIAARMKSPEMLRAMQSLRQRGLLKVVMDGKTVVMKFDLSSIGL